MTLSGVAGSIREVRIFFRRGILWPKSIHMGFVLHVSTSGPFTFCTKVLSKYVSRQFYIRDQQSFSRGKIQMKSDIQDWVSDKQYEETDCD